MMRIVYGGLNPSTAGWPDGDLTVTKLCEFSRRIADHLDGELHVIDGGATFSADGLYRYRLWRVLGRHPKGGDLSAVVRFDIVNLSAWISTDPDGLFRIGFGDDPFGPENQRHIDAALAEADIAVAAWGSLASLPPWMRYQGETVLRAFTRSHDVMCLGRTKDGSPRHPSRIAYATPLEPFRARREAA